MPSHREARRSYESFLRAWTPACTRPRAGWRNRRRRIHSPRIFGATTAVCATTSFAQPTRCRKTNTDFGRRRMYEHSRSRSPMSPTTNTTSAPPPRASSARLRTRTSRGRLSKKADLVVALKDAFAYCDAAYDAMTDVTSLEPSSGMKGPVQILVLELEPLAYVGALRQHRRVPAHERSRAAVE